MYLVKATIEILSFSQTDHFIDFLLGFVKQRHAPTNLTQLKVLFSSSACS